MDGTAKAVTFARVHGRDGKRRTTRRTIAIESGLRA